jgi:Cu(I)/Ag(I) efflux system periplasmic protein CusF
MSMRKYTFGRLAAVALLGVASSFPSIAVAQAPAADAGLTQAEVRKVDKDNRKITLKHEAIKSLDMPPMTMVFQVSDPALLDQVKSGDKVRFAAIEEAGRYTVTEIQPAK